MKVLFVSQCTKRASIQTRRIIDQFAERKGQGVWHTHVTEQGLATVKRLLRATARKNTAVACHLFKRGPEPMELLWIVGNPRQFNRDGSIPTHITSKNVLRADDENDWNTGESIAILVELSALFHDFGKANEAFQQKLKNRPPTRDLLRHEWISLLLFKEFVANRSDKEWLERLSTVVTHERELLEEEGKFLEKFSRDPTFAKRCTCNPLEGLPRLAKFIGWLILSHHQLPRPLDNDNELPLRDINEWMKKKHFVASWNVLNQDYNDPSKSEALKRVLSFPHKTLFHSQTWRTRAWEAAVRALKYYDQLDRDWFQDRFSMHLTRAVLMLADHLYSARDIAKIEKNYRDETYAPYANTDKKTRSLKQKLDEHTIGVSQRALWIARRLPSLQEALPSIMGSQSFKQRSRDKAFVWQDKAYDVVAGLKERSAENGFFGVNLASTGCGKTLANARIMYALADEAKGCRFSIALGLRVLTLQTGKALQQRLKLKEEELAVMIGSSAFQELYERDSHEEEQEELIDEGNEIHYEGYVVEGSFGEWLKLSPKVHKLLSAPVLVCTIDHLILATEGWRGGKQIPSILRLLTSDLVLDEPDDFDVRDLHALCRLVNFAGVFGSRVLISSATLPPSILQALFSAYAAGRQSFNAVCRKQEGVRPIPCAWFDEFGVVHSEHLTVDSYQEAHHAFVAERMTHLEKQPVLRRAALVPITPSSNEKQEVHQAVADQVKDSIYKLHDRHHQICPFSSKQVSIGLVRFANIDPLVEVAKRLFHLASAEDYCLHICVYHSRFTMLMRSKIEASLDRVLARHRPEEIWKMEEIVTALSKDPARRHIFVVMATAVAEVGRDHDYDWAIVEPSSMRSIIQLAGRVQRHRRMPPSEPNVLILNKNIRALLGQKAAYIKPGFETPEGSIGACFRLTNKDLSLVVDAHQLEEITAKPRLYCPGKEYTKKIVDLEHARLAAELLGEHGHDLHASLWWQNSPDWCWEVQRHTQFRKQDRKPKTYIDYLEEEEALPRLCEWSKEGHLRPIEPNHFKRDSFTPSSRNYPWINGDLVSEIIRYAAEKNMSVAEVSRKFATIDLDPLEGTQKWTYDPIFGFFRDNA